MLPDGVIIVTDSPREFQWFNNEPLNRLVSKTVGRDGKGIGTATFLPDIKRIEINFNNRKQHVLSTKFADNEITNISMALDQSNRYALATSMTDATDNNMITLTWYDISQNEITDAEFANVKMGFVILDELRRELINDSDILFFYIRTTDNKLCYRIQRERFQTEYELVTLLPNEEILRVGHTRDYRVQIQTRRVIGTYSFSAFIDNKRKPILDVNGMPLWKVETLNYF